MIRAPSPLWVSLLLLACACDTDDPPPAPTPPPAPAFDAADASPPAGDLSGIGELAPEPAPSAGVVEQSPAHAGAGAQFRRKRALELLAGGDIAAHLPERAHDPQVPFDPDRVASMAPPAPNRTPRILLSKPLVDGALHVDVVRRFLRRNLSQVRRCYEKELKRSPGSKGTVSLSWTVGRRGKVTDAKVTDSTFEDSDVSTCMRKALRTWSFAPPPDGDADTVTAKYVLIPPTG